MTHYHTTSVKITELSDIVYIENVIVKLKCRRFVVSASLSESLRLCSLLSRYFVDTYACKHSIETSFMQSQFDFIHIYTYNNIKWFKSYSLVVTRDSQQL